MSLRQRAERGWRKVAFGQGKLGHARRLLTVAATVIQAVGRGFCARRVVSVELAMRRQQMQRVTMRLMMVSGCV